MILGPFHAAVCELISNGSSVAVFTFLPDDPAEVPCCVINHPGGDEHATKGLMTLSLDVILLGRRISDEDSQGELLALADQLFAILGGTRNVSIGERTYLRCRRIIPSTVDVAGLTYPAYIATVQAEVLSPSTGGN